MFIVCIYFNIKCAIQNETKVMHFRELGKSGDDFLPLLASWYFFLAWAASRTSCL